MKKYFPYIIIVVLLITTIMLFRKMKKLKAEKSGEAPEAKMRVFKEEVKTEAKK